VSVEVRTEGFERIEEALRLAEERGADLSAAFTRILYDFQGEQEQVFAGSGAFGGRGGWEPLSESYAAWKEQVVAGAPILTLTGLMRASLTDVEAEGAVRTVTADELFIGTDLMVGPWNLASLHHTGTKRGMPARPPIRVTDEQLERWLQIIAEHLVGAQTSTA
jgi:hypothetical protein